MYKTFEAMIYLNTFSYLWTTFYHLKTFLKGKRAAQSKETTSFFQLKRYTNGTERGVA